MDGDIGRRAYPLSSICVFCGSQAGIRPTYAAAARQLGHALARRDVALVYGGGRVGLMGVLADAALAGGGRVIGVIPEALDNKEIAHAGCSELHVVSGMHERKALMASRADAFLALPGGVGTYEEFFEILTWAVLGLHRKPLGVLNVDGYFDPLNEMLLHAVSEGFARERYLELVTFDNEVEALLDHLSQTPTPVVGPKWIKASET